MLSEEEYAQFRQLVERQSPRQLRRYLDYGRRVRQGVGLAELVQWVGRILLDDQGVYGVEDKARAFEIGACERLARSLPLAAPHESAVVTVAGSADKVLLLRLLIAQSSPAPRAALSALFAQRYRRTWDWVRQRAVRVAAEAGAEDGKAQPGGGAAAEGSFAGDALMARFLEELELIDPLPGGTFPGQVERALQEAREREDRLRREAEVATDRTERALTRLEALQQEVAQLRRSTREERDTAEKLRAERSRRIKLEREVRESARELGRLRAEYLKLDGRLRESAQRKGGQGFVVDLDHLAEMGSEQLLGVASGASDEDFAQVRRRFAAAFHSDRAVQLPPWVANLFDRLLGLVNAACDRQRR